MNTLKLLTLASGFTPEEARELVQRWDRLDSRIVQQATYTLVKDLTYGTLDRIRQITEDAVVKNIVDVTTDDDAEYDDMQALAYEVSRVTMWTIMAVESRDKLTAQEFDVLTSPWRTVFSPDDF